MMKNMGASAKADRATRPSDQAPAGLGDTASVPCAHEARIARYLAAYEAANGKQFVETIAYDRGWYRFRNKWRQTRAVRAAGLDRMITMLEWRASPDGRQFEGKRA